MEESRVRDSKTPDHRDLAESEAHGTVAVGWWNDKLSVLPRMAPLWHYNLAAKETLPRSRNEMLEINPGDH